MRYALSILIIFTFLVANSQSKSTISDSRIGILKTQTNEILGYGFVAMNKNVVFTAAHNITFEQNMIFEDSKGNQHTMRVVATDNIGDIGVLMTNNDIHEDPFALNLNYTIGQETSLFGFGMDNSSNSQVKQGVELKGKSSKIEKKKEFKSIDIVVNNAPQRAGMPLLNAYNEVVGIVIDSKLEKKGIHNCKVSILDSDMWKKM
ncbi:MAG: hypothetical protein P8M34_07100 [Saprospiraceae bacterium]|nr:hypothetical protein [Saprospiraceae bacterium]|tara:strand:+ start:1092 stop:1703 length:612 start_codon:yes stop_codon:yes gene_type:complete